nr:hypothetical protein [Tanacetum cinerariifolium]
MSANSTVIFSSVHSEARSWSIPSDDPYEEAAQAGIPKANTPPQNRLLATPRRGCKVGESSAAATREALARSEAHCKALEVRVSVLETHAHRLEWQRQAVDDFAFEHIMRT